MNRQPPDSGESEKAGGWNGRIFRGRSWKAAVLALLSGCILQGPWDYSPENSPVYQGLFVNAVIVAEKPVRDICIEKLLMLTEEYTDAFPFYSAAQVSIEGVFDGSLQTVALSPDTRRANCFVDTSNRLPSTGERYLLSARITWDSAGTSVVTRLTAEAAIPEYFFMRDTAWAPAIANPGLAADTSTDTSQSAYTMLLGLIRPLPDSVQAEIINRYQDTVLILSQLGDTAIAAFIAQEMPNLLAILNKFPYKYVSGDSALFLTGELSFTLPHRFSASASEDVAGVQVTQNLTNTTGEANNGLGPIFGAFERDTADYYYSEDTRSLMTFPNILTSDGFSLLDSMPIPNPAFNLGLNTFFFYGFEKAYVDYQQTEIGGQQDNRVKPIYNVTGAAGFFAGAVVDSFDVFIKADPQTEVYPREVTKVAYCGGESRRSGGNRWVEDRQCRDFYPVYCDSIGWQNKVCLPDLVSTGLELGVSEKLLLDSLRSLNESGALTAVYNPDSVAPPPPDMDIITRMQLAILALDSAVLEKPPAKYFTPITARRQGEIRYCVETNYPDSLQACKDVKDSCQSLSGINQCKDYLWQYCLDNRWIPAACGLGLVSYCTDKPRLSEVLCGHADEYCIDNADEPLCILAEKNR